MTPSAVPCPTGPFKGTVVLMLLAMMAAIPVTVKAQQADPAPRANPLAPRITGPQPTLAPVEEGKPPPPPVTTEPIDEITIIAPRRDLPDFQSTDEFYRAEFEALRGEYEKPAQAPQRAFEVFESGGASESPNTRSTLRDQVRNSPRLRDTFSSAPPRADPTPP